MNTLDIFLCIPLLWGAWRGFRNGFIYEICLLMALVLGVMGGYKLSGWASDLLRDWFDISSRWLPYISFLVVFIAVVALVILFAKMLEGAVKATGMHWANKLTGTLLGILKWGFGLSVLLYFFKPFDEKYSLLPAEKKENSFLFEPLSDYSVFIVPKMKEGWKELREAMKEKDAQPPLSEPDVTKETE